MKTEGHGETPSVKTQSELLFSECTPDRRFEYPKLTVLNKIEGQNTQSLANDNNADDLNIIQGFY